MNGKDSGTIGAPRSWPLSAEGCYPSGMSYAEDLAALARFEKLRIASLIVAFSASLAGLLLELEWLAWPRAFAWASAGIFALLEARMEKRLGRDPDGSLLRAVLLFVIAAIFFVYAVKG